MIYLLYIIAGIVPLQFALNIGDGFDVAIMRLLAVVLTAVWLIDGLIAHDVTIRKSFVSIGLATLIGMVGLSIINVQEYVWFLRKLVFLVNFIAIYFVVASYSWNKEILRKFIAILAFSGVLSCMIGVVLWLGQFVVGAEQIMMMWSQYIAPVFLGHTFADTVMVYSSAYVSVAGVNYLRLIGLFPDPHICAFFAEMILPIVGFLAWKSHGARRVLWGVGALVVFIAILLTFTRGAYLALVVGGMIIGVMILRYYHRNMVFVIGIIFGVMFAAYGFVASPVGNRLMSVGDFSDGSVSARLVLWQDALASIVQHPFLGVGLGNYILTAMPHADYRVPYYAHNTYLDIMAELGVVAGVIWVMVVVGSGLRMLYVGWHRERQLALALGLSLLMFSVHSMFDTAIFSVHVLPLLMIILGISVLPRQILVYD